MECKVFFDSLPSERPEVRERARLIDEQFPGARCEAESVSSSSPGVVQDAEFAHRFVFSPVHMDGEKIKTAFFSDCQSVGLSCQRSEIEDVDRETHDRGLAIVAAWNKESGDPDTQRSYLGVVSANCGNIRLLKPHPSSSEHATAWDQAMMGIYDTGRLGDERHIDVFQLAVGRRKSDLKQARRDLALVFTTTPCILSLAKCS